LDFELALLWARGGWRLAGSLEILEHSEGEEDVKSGREGN